MHVIFQKGRCPVCGTKGKRKKFKIMVCPSCGTVFNEFGILALSENIQNTENN